MDSNSPRIYGFNVFNSPPEDFFEYASQNNLRHIEINLTQSHSSLESFNSERINKLKLLCEKHNVRLSFHIPFKINISDIIRVIRNENLAYFKGCIDLASKIDATHITVHIGNFYWFPVEKLMRKKALDRFIKYFKDIIELSEKYKVAIALENVVPIPHGSDFYLLGDNVNDFNYIFNSVQSDYLKFCLDTGHANMGEGILPYIQNFSRQLTSIHFHDNIGKNDDHLPIGKGSVPWAKLAEELQNLNYKGPIISECRNIKPHEAAEVFEDYFDKYKKR
jgi:sugar phosphate isomerase/epimerase